MSCMLLWLLSLAAVHVAQQVTAEDGQGGVQGFVTVRDGQFELQGRPWFIAGSNIYYLADRA